MISVLQASAWYPPVSVGGTEVYLTGLVRALRPYGVASRLVAPLADAAADGYEHDGAVVRTYRVEPARSRAELRGDAPHAGFRRFRELLAEERPEIYHQHSWTRGLGGAHLRAAREAGLKTVLTVHTPNNLCLRGTMMRFGAEPCDGYIDPPRCGACWSHSRGAPKAIAGWLGGLPPGLSAAVENTLPYSRAATALTARALGERRRREFARVTADADRIVAVSEWLFEALACNGVPPEKLVMSRQGVDPDFAAAAARAAADRDAKPRLRLLYLGRWDVVKGLHVLVRAVRRLPANVPVTLTIHAVGDGPEERRYAARMRRLAAGDARIEIAPHVPRCRLATTLSQADALAVPSLCLETGPLVVLEAKAAKLPVIGSRLGGIAELVHEPEDGLLVAPGDVEAWAAAIVAMVETTVKRAARSTTIRPVRSICDAAAEMAKLYYRLMQE